MKNWWQITADWKVENGTPGGVGLPVDGFVKGGTLVMLEAGDGANLFWVDGSDMPCSMHVPNLSSIPGSQTLVTFAGKNFSCVINEFTLTPLDSPSQLTVQLTMSVGGLRRPSGNTGTFIAQAVAGPPPPPPR
jgi:hypothetical protein